MSKMSDLFLDVVEMHNRGYKATTIAALLDIPYIEVEKVLDSYSYEYLSAFYGTPIRDRVIGA
jgi:hypothetical protein